MEKDKPSKDNFAEIWAQALKILEKTPTPSSLVWISPLALVKKDEEEYKKDTLTLKSTMAFAVNQINERHINEVQSAVNEAAGYILPVKVIFKSDNKKQIKKRERQILTEEQMDNLKQMNSFSSLNLKYTFENFVEGDNSKVAYNAAKIVSENPGKKYNPLFITGNVGIGKTHLMQAIGHEILKKYPNLKVKYIKTEEFTNEIVKNLFAEGKGDKMRKFHDQYRNVDVLLMDDVQFMMGKDRTQEEVFHTFETLYNNGKQIVFASDTPVSTFDKTQDRLKSRMEWGLEVEIKPPSLDVRIEIVKQHAKRCNYEITNEVAELLAKNYTKNVRELEGAYNKVSAYASIQGIELTEEKAREILGLNINKKSVSANDIIKKCAEYFNIEESQITGKERQKEVAEARKIAIFLTKDILDLSYPCMAKIFNKTHTTIMYSFDTTKKALQTDKVLMTKITELKELITK